MGQGELAALTSPPKFTDIESERAYLKERLVASLRIFAKLGFDHHVAGHLTVRDPEHHDSFWVNPFGLSFAIMTVSDLILVSHDGKVIGGGKPGRRVVNAAGFAIHSAIHRARPDVNAICHSHSVYGKAWSTLVEPLPITTQDACSFYNDCALLKDFGGVVITTGEGNAVAGALGQKKAVVLANHGILTVGTTIDSAVAWFILLEEQCHVALLAKAAGTPVPIDEPQAIFTHKETGSERSGFFMASPYFQNIEREREEYIK
ncbi:class II aldolase/adducin, N-terminal domain-containing protein [Leucosporidium creatinivorum]|uniref:Class II aldolase/adducin, N-terminal domain-containing protein n=1 Tax=Leucosporidium creatinivorum TaxID=106004 RepID=A0A1Y2FZR5_9BASI|nr:class II aldolase/adducin, N-terminal domain-containing protein [Leucosporidium creatinivorum]